MPRGANGSGTGTSPGTHVRSEQPSPASGSLRRNRPQSSPIEEQIGPKSGASRSAPTSIPATPAQAALTSHGVHAEHQHSLPQRGQCAVITELVELLPARRSGQIRKALICRACRGRSAPISLTSVRHSHRSRFNHPGPSLSA